MRSGSRHRLVGAPGRKHLYLKSALTGLDMIFQLSLIHIYEESTQIAYAKACGKMYHAPVFANGDTRKQLLARSIYLLYKKESLWTQSQRIRAEILFKEYPDIKKGYYLDVYKRQM